LKLFRPNLENPANKNATKELNEDELKRTAAFQEVSLIIKNILTILLYFS
jgi:hypothetical protein